MEGFLLFVVALVVIHFAFKNDGPEYDYDDPVGDGYGNPDYDPTKP